MPRSASDSQTSRRSTGFGPAEPIRPPDTEYTPRLVAEGEIPTDQLTYDCVLYLFFCEEHKRIAVSNTERTRVVWLPFVAIPKDVTWEQASADGVALILGKRVEERIDGLYNPTDGKANIDTLPRYRMTLINVLRLQLASGAFEARLTQVVRLVPTPGYRCCQKTVTLEWIDYKDVIEDRVPLLWGPEVKLSLGKMLKSVPVRHQRYIFEFGQDNAIAFLTRPDKQHQFQAKLMHSCKMDTETVLALYGEYVDYCFPSFFMSNESFRLYLARYGYEKKDPKLTELFKAVTYNHKGYLDFFEYLVALLCLDPSTDNLNEARLKMLLRYYDQDNDKKLSQAEFAAMVKDLNPGVSENKVGKEIVPLLWEKCQIKGGRLDHKDFRKAILSGLIKGTEKLCRAPCSIVSKIVQQRKRPSEQSTGENGHVKRRDRGLCSGCRAQNMDYALHCVTLDTEARCGNPARTINKMNVKIDFNESIMSEARYSAEYRFGSGSVSNVFLELIRKTADVSQEDWNCIRSLCESISDFFISEDRLIKLNAPVVVIGDILGNLAPIVAFDKLLCPSVPVLQNNMLFLGNYIGNGTHNLEVICFVFSLKLQVPNKVILLRGFNENGKEAHKLLLPECQRKYGPEVGSLVCNLICEAFSKMPFGAIIDESVVCMHSGIPKSSGNRVTILEDIPKTLNNVEDCLPAYEIISKQPIESTSSSTVTALQFNRDHFHSFMAGNDFSHLIRGHQIPPDQYELNFANQCITLSSNTATPMVAFLDVGKKLQCDKVKDVPATIRLVQLDLSPTDSN